MSEKNKKTLESYEKTYQMYVKKTISTISGELKDRIDTALGLIKKTDVILEIGTWSGRDADYIEAQWYTVQRSDATQWFVQYNIGRGKPCLLIDLLDNTYTKKHHLIFANAVFLHFTKDDLWFIVDDLKKNISPWGFLAFSLQKWLWDEYKSNKWDAERYFCYRKEDEITDFLDAHGYHIRLIKTTADNKWIHIISQLR